MEPLVSVIIPTYNRIGPLSELIESLSKQTYKTFEVIIINDNGEPVDVLLYLYPELKIKIINLTENQKHVVARNVGVRAAAGEYIMLCDDDDIILSSHIETMISEIHDFDLVFSDVEIVEYTTINNTRVPINRFLFAYEFDSELMKIFSTFVSSGCMFKRELLDDIGPFDEDVYHYWDWDFILRASLIHQVKKVPIAGVLYAFTTSGDNLSGSLNEMEPYLQKLINKHNLGQLPTKNFFLLLEEPEIVERKTASKILWDGRPFISRFHSKK